MRASHIMEQQKSEPHISLTCLHKFSALSSQNSGLPSHILDLHGQFPRLDFTTPRLIKTSPGLVKSKPGLVKAFGQGSDHRTDTVQHKLCKSTTLFLQGTSSVRTFAASKDNSTFICKNTVSYLHLP